jgi:hypothetical protein
MRIELSLRQCPAEPRIVWRETIRSFNVVIGTWQYFRWPVPGTCNGTIPRGYLQEDDLMRPNLRWNDIAVRSGSPAIRLCKIKDSVVKGYEVRKPSPFSPRQIH